MSRAVRSGSGNPWVYGDVADAGDRIAAISQRGRIDPANAAEVIHAEGHIACPGFIHIQSHSILPLTRDGRSLSKITQGVTTEIMGEAWTPAPFGGRIADPMPRSLALGRDDAWSERARSWTRFGGWLNAMTERGVAPNVGYFLGGGTLREYVTGMEMATPNADELAEMRRVVREAMEEGAFGVSYALVYPPDAYAGTDEIVEVCKVVAEHHGVYITHVRSESDELVEAIDEAIEIGRRSGASVEIYHLNASGRDNWHTIPTVIEQVNHARAEGLT